MMGGLGCRICVESMTTNLKIRHAIVFDHVVYNGFDLIFMTLYSYILSILVI